MLFRDFIAKFSAPRTVKLNLGPGATDVERLEHYAALAQMNPKGFRSSPTSRKNPRFHDKKPSTLLEALAKRVEAAQ